MADTPNHTASSKAQEIPMTPTPDAALAHREIEREIVLSRVIKAKRDVVFAAWTEPEHLPNWFGCGSSPAKLRVSKASLLI